MIIFLKLVKKSNRQKLKIRTFIICLLLICFSINTIRADVILQYFESKYTTIEHRMPDIFMAGYDALWIPPVNKADTGGFSVGYDVFDRFNFGSPFDRTLYGTEEELKKIIAEAHRAGLLVFPDTVLKSQRISRRLILQF